MFKLADLPEQCSIELLKQWIDLTEVARVDTVFCNSRYRQLYLDLLSHGAFYVAGIRLNKSKAWRQYVQWLILRRVKVTFLDLSKIYFLIFPTKFHEGFKIDSSRITYLHLNGNHDGKWHYNLLADFVNSCKSLKCLVLRELELYGDQILMKLSQQLLSQLTKIHLFVLNSCDNSFGLRRASAVHRHLSFHCKNLTEFECNYFFECTSYTTATAASLLILRCRQLTSVVITTREAKRVLYDVSNDRSAVHIESNLSFDLRPLLTAVIDATHSTATSIFIHFKVAKYKYNNTIAYMLKKCTKLHTLFIVNCAGFGETVASQSNGQKEFIALYSQASKSLTELTVLDTGLRNNTKAIKLTLPGLKELRL